MAITNQNKAYLLALTAVGFWSTMATAFKITLRHVGFMELVFLSSMVSTLILALLLIIKGKLQLIGQLRTKDFAFGAIRGLLNPFLYYLVLFKAYTLLKAQEAGTLNYIWPILLVLLSIPLLKQKISIKSILAILISFFGIVIISTEGNILSLRFNEPLGVGLALISGLFWALYWILNVKDQHDELLKLFVNFIFGSIFTCVALLFKGDVHMPEIYALSGIIYIGLFEMGFTYFIWLSALQLSENTARISNLVYLSPFLSLMIIRMMIGEKILLSTIVGLGFIIAGILAQQYVGRIKS